MGQAVVRPAFHLEDSWVLPGISITWLRTHGEQRHRVRVFFQVRVEHSFGVAVGPVDRDGPPHGTREHDRPVVKRGDDQVLELVVERATVAVRVVARLIATSAHCLAGDPSTDRPER